MEGLVTFAVRTGAVVVAEGVEDAATAEALHALGVAHAQGWLFGRPDRPVAHTAGSPRPDAVPGGGVAVDDGGQATVR